MASNDYYNPSPNRPGLRSNPTSPTKPLPPDPYTAYNPHHTQPSPSYMASSFEDSSYHPYAEQSHQDIPSPYYSSGGGGREYEPNPYSDNIPLRQHPSKGDSDNMMHDPLPNDPTIVDRRSRYPGSPRQKQSFFKRKQPWVVYTFTLIQVIVFIAELAKNGTSTTSNSVAVEANMPRRPHQDAHRDPPCIQSHDRSVSLRPYQYGCSVCPMYAQNLSRFKRHHPVAMSEHHYH
jgi:hypothetical protein